MAEATALKIPDHNKEFTLITDCSNKGAGAVLTQEEKGTRSWGSPHSGREGN